MLQAIIYGKRAKNHQKKKQIVDAERFFDQVAGKEFEGRLGATEIEHSESKEDGDSDPAKTSNGRLANLDLVRAAVENTQVQRRPHKIEIREAAIASLGWIGISVLFGFGVFYFRGPQPALEFFTGYLIEKALSVDNLFLFLVIFRAFAVDDRLQNRLLEWVVAGALSMRGVMIALGAELIKHFSWVMYVLGAFLIYAGVLMLFFHKGDFHPE